MVFSHKGLGNDYCTLFHKMLAQMNLDVCECNAAMVNAVSMGIYLFIQPLFRQVILILKLQGATYRRYLVATQ